MEFFILNSIYHDYNKNCAFDQKMVKIKFVDLFKNIFFVCRRVCPENLIFNF